MSETEREAVVVTLEHERQVVFTGRSAVLDGEREVLVASAEVEVGVTPSMELRAAAKGLTWSQMACGLSGMVDEDDGEMKLSLELAQESEDSGDFGGKVFVDSMEADEWVEEQECGSESADGVGEAFLVELGV